MISGKKGNQKMYFQECRNFFFCVSPHCFIGMGKTLCYSVLPTFANVVGHTTISSTMVLVVSTLLALMEDLLQQPIKSKITASDNNRQWRSGDPLGSGYQCQSDESIAIPSVQWL